MAVYTVPSTRPYLRCGKVTFCMMFLPSKVHTIYISEVPGLCLLFSSDSLVFWSGPLLGHLYVPFVITFPADS